MGCTQQRHHIMGGKITRHCNSPDLRAAHRRNQVAHSAETQAARSFNIGGCTSSRYDIRRNKHLDQTTGQLLGEVAAHNGEAVQQA